MKILAAVALVLLVTTMRSTSADYLPEEVPDSLSPPSTLLWLAVQQRDDASHAKEKQILSIDPDEIQFDPGEL